MKKRITFIFTLLILPVALASADNPATQTELLTLSECLKEAALNNPELKAAFEGWKVALEQIPQARALEDPKFTFGYYIQEVETRVGPMDSKLAITQTFPWFGKIEAKTGVASAKAKAAQQKYQSAKLTLFYHVKKAFHEYCYWVTAVEIAKENLSLMKHFEEVAQAKYKTASASHPDIIRTQVELATLENVLDTLKELQSPISANLNLLMNRPADAPLPPPEKTSPVYGALDQKSILQQLIRSNPELAELDWEIEAARSAVELAKTNFYPNIGVGVDWTQIGPASNPSVSDSGKDAVALMFSINIPLWRDSYKASERQAMAQLRRTRHEKTSKQNEKITAAITLLYNIEDSRRKAKLFGQTLLSKAEELTRESEIAYKAGTIDFLSLIDAQRMLLRYQLDYERAVTNYQQRVAELEMLIGEELTTGYPASENALDSEP